MAEPLDLDAIRAEMADAMHAKDCACGKTMYADHHTPEVPEWYAEMADAALTIVEPQLAPLADAHQPMRDLLEYAYILRAYGERPPGGNENWREFDRRLETVLQGLAASDAAC